MTHWHKKYTASTRIRCVIGLINQSGHNTKNRDAEAAVNIAIAGVSTIISGETLLRSA